jgi:TolB-like protein
VVYLFENCSLDTDRRELTRAGDAVQLQPQVFDLLQYLIRNRDRVVSKDDLIAAVWGGRIVSESAMSVRINAARVAIGDDGDNQRLIRTLPRKGFRFVGAVREEPTVAEVVTRPRVSPQLEPPITLPDKPSIAVLPFDNLSGDPDQAYFADGMVEEIITALSRIRWLFVIARNSTFTYKGQAVDVKRVGRELGVRYALEGSVRKTGTHVRITAQLIDTRTGAHLWADRFDGSLEKVFELQDEVAIAVAGVIEPTLEMAEARRASERPTEDLTAYDLYLRALPHWISWEKERASLALGLLSQAISRDPRYAPALALAAWCHLLFDNNNWTDDPVSNRQSGIQLARNALQITSEDPVVLTNAAFVLCYFGEDADASIRLLERALTLNPSCAWGWLLIGFLHLWAGYSDAAIPQLERSMRLNPRGHRAFQLTGIGIAHFFNRRYDKALHYLLISLEEQPFYIATYRFAAACYGHMGRFDEAADIIERVRRLTPALVPEARFYRSPEQRELYISGLRLAAAAEASRAQNTESAAPNLGLLADEG